jgi:hypothetical protein
VPFACQLRPFAADSLAALALGQIRVHALDRYQLRAVSLDDDHVLEPNRAGVLDRLVSGDDVTVLVQHDRAAGAKVAQGVLDHLLAALGALVCVARIGRERTDSARLYSALDAAGSRFGLDTCRLLHVSFSFNTGA